MRLLVALFLSIFSFLAVDAQPVNDNCEDAIDLGMTPYCDSTDIFNNIDATPSDVGLNNLPPCFKGGSAENDVWFTFTTRDAIEYVFNIQGMPDTLNGDTFGLFNPEVAFYVGGCDTNDLELLPICFSAPNQVNFLDFTLDTSDLDANTTYFMRINASGVGGINNGSFKLCIEEIDFEFSIDEEGSHFCEGRVYDTGGPSDDYGNNEEYIFTICPDDVHECLTLTMGNYELFGDSSFSDYFKIYDGADTTGMLIGASSDMRDTTGKPGVTGINNAVCQMFYASSGCITIYWKTDSSGVGPGFNATWVCSQDTCPQFDSLIVNTPVGGTEVVDAIKGRLIDINVGEVNCIDTAYGTFVGDNSDLGFSKGLLLTTGHAAAVGRPNTLPNTGFKNDTTGIPLLDSLSQKIYGDTTTTHDGCSIDLEFTPETDVMAVEVILGSEEYPECVDSQLTDIMGLFYTTAGYMGDSVLNNHTNIARLNDSTDIQISTINPFDTVNWEYYRNMLNSQSIEYDGLTADGAGGSKFILLTQNVEPCQVNHLITAIADRGDSLYDSGIFLSNMRCLTPVISLNTSTGFPFFIEECNPGDDFVTISFPRQYEDDTEWTISFEGDAQEGSDFEWPSGETIIQPAGRRTIQYPIDVINDGIEEGSERFTIKLSRDWGCGEVELTELEVEIRDRLLVDITTEGDFCKGDTFSLFANPRDLAYIALEWTPGDIFNDPRRSVQRIVLEDDVQIVLTGTTYGPADCQWTDTFNITVIDPQIRINALDPTGICRGESVSLQSIDNVSGTNRMWFPDQNISSTTSDMVTVTPNQTTTYSVTVDTANCEDTASIVIEVENLAFPNIINDTTICLGDPIQLAQLGNPNNQSLYAWTPPTDLDNPASPDPIATPSDTITYTLRAQTTKGYCSDSGMVTINVIDVGVNILPVEDTIYMCLGDTTSFSAQTRGEGEISWGPNDGVIGGTNGLDLTVSPDQTTTYTVTYANEFCSPQDRITVVVDRLPQGIEAIPQKDVYCPGETIELTVDFGGVSQRNSSFMWTPNAEILSGQGTQSATIAPTSNTTYSVSVINGECDGDYSIDITVLDFTPFAGNDTIVCEGDAIPLNPNLADQYPDSLVSYVWSAIGGLSFEDVTDPNTSITASNGGGNAKITVTIDECIVSDSFDIVTSDPGVDSIYILPGDTIANCAEVDVVVEFGNNASSEPDPSTIEWTFVDTSGRMVEFDTEAFRITHTPNTSGTFTVNYLDNNGCSHSESIQIEVLQPQYISEETPKAFTPNGDGLNDVYRIKFVDDIEYQVESFKVFSRWGQLVYEAKDNSGWDGRMPDGSDALSEVYLVAIQFIDDCGQIVDPVITDVTLIR